MSDDAKLSESRIKMADETGELSWAELTPLRSLSPKLLSSAELTPPLSELPALTCLLSQVLSTTGRDSELLHSASAWLGLQETVPNLPLHGQSWELFTWQSAAGWDIVLHTLPERPPSSSVPLTLPDASLPSSSTSILSSDGCDSETSPS